MLSSTIRSQHFHNVSCHFSVLCVTAGRRVLTISGCIDTSGTVRTTNMSSSATPAQPTDPPHSNAAKQLSALQRGGALILLAVILVASLLWFHFTGRLYLGLGPLYTQYFIAADMTLEGNGTDSICIILYSPKYYSLLKFTRLHSGREVHHRFRCSCQTKAIACYPLYIPSSVPCWNKIG
jgi:hypothetical protein